MTTERVSDFLRYYLVFSPTEQELPAEEFVALLEARLREARTYVLTQLWERFDDTTKSA